VERIGLRTPVSSCCVNLGRLYRAKPAFQNCKFQRPASSGSTLPRGHAESTSIQSQQTSFCFSRLAEGARSPNSCRCSSVADAKAKSARAWCSLRPQAGSGQLYARRIHPLAIRNKCRTASQSAWFRCYLKSCACCALSRQGACCCITNHSADCGSWLLHVGNRR